MSKQLAKVETRNSLAFTESDKKNLKNSICKDLDDNEFETFIKVCVDSRLNPFKRQIYAIKRRGRAGPVVTYQTGIDGFRAIANRTGLHQNTKIFWKAKGADKPWLDYWEEDFPPSVAKAEVYKKGFSEPFTAIARFSSYKVETNPLWKSMPENMISKCAESLCLRKAFPEDLSGLYSAEELSKPIDAPVDEIKAIPAEYMDDMVEKEEIEIYKGLSHQKQLAKKLFEDAGAVTPEAMQTLNNALVESETMFTEEAMKLAIRKALN